MPRLPLITKFHALDLAADFHGITVIIHDIQPLSADLQPAGGKLIYSTCTIDHLENEDQRNWILETLPFEPVSIEGAFGSQIKEETMKDGYIQLLPGRYPCDGFFISAFRRKA